MRYAIIYIVQKTSAFIDSKTKILDYGNIANQHTKAYRHKQKGLILFRYSEINNYYTNQKHYYITVVD